MVIVIFQEPVDPILGFAELIEIQCRLILGLR